MATPSLPELASERVDAEARNETLRIILRESLRRYRNELMDTDEREILWDRISKIHTRLGLKNA